MKDARSNQATETQAYEALRLAQIHAEATKMAGKSSAVFCVEEARKFFNEGRTGFAHAWSVQSLAHSIGFFHPDMAKARDGVAGS